MSLPVVELTAGLDPVGAPVTTTADGYDTVTTAYADGSHRLVIEVVSFAGELATCEARWSTADGAPCLGPCGGPSFVSWVRIPAGDGWAWRREGRAVAEA